MQVQQHRDLFPVRMRGGGLVMGLTYKTAGGGERTVSRRALYNAFKAHDAELAETA